MNMKMRISKRTIDTLLDAPAGTVIRDDKLIGFQARKNGNGSISYVYEYRSSRGRGGLTRRVTIGRDREGGGLLTPDQARAIAEQFSTDVVAGRDPAAERARSRQTPTFTAFATEHLAAAEKIAVAQPRSAPLRLGSIKNMQSQVRKHIGPAFGNKKLDAITKADVLRLHSSMGAATPVAANSMLETVRHVIRAARDLGHVDEDFHPTKGIRLFKKNKRERFLTITELERLGAAIREAETIGLPWEITNDPERRKHVPTAEQRTKLEADCLAAVRLLIFTGCRLREILHAQWDDVDLERGVLFVHGKTGRRAVLLPAPAALILANLPRVGPFVFPGRGNTADDPHPRSDLARTWTAIRKRAGLAGLRLHDLRHSFASFAAAGGASLYIVGKLLGHSAPQTTARYAHLADDPVRAVAERTAAVVSGALEGRTGASVRKARR